MQFEMFLKNNKFLIFISCLFFAVSFQLRTSGWVDLVDWDLKEIIIPSNDAPYHASLIRDSIEGKIDQIRQFDVRTYAPQGYQHHWPGLFDKAIAIFGKMILFCVNDIFPIKLMIGFIPPFIGALTVVFLFLGVSSITGPIIASLISVMAALNPYHISLSYFANLDHHFFEIFLTLVYFLIINSKFGEKIKLIGGFVVAIVGLYSTTTFFLFFLITNVAFLTKERKLLLKLEYILIPTILAINLIFNFPLGFTYKLPSSLHVLIICALVIVKNFKKLNRYFHILLTVACLVGGYFLWETIASSMMHIFGSSININNNELNRISLSRVNIPIVRSVAILIFLTFVSIVIKYRKSIVQAFKKIEVKYLVVFTSLVVLSVLQSRFFRDSMLILTAMTGILSYVCLNKRLAGSMILTALLFNFDIGGVLIRSNLLPKETFIDYNLMKTIDTLQLKNKIIIAPWNLGHKIHYYTNHSNMTNPIWDWEMIQNEKDYVTINTATSTEVIEKILDKYSTDILIISYSEIDYHFWEHLLDKTFTQNDLNQQLNYQFFQPTPSKNLASSFRVLYEFGGYKILRYMRDNIVVLPKINKQLVISTKLKKSSGHISNYYLIFGPGDSYSKQIVAYDSSRRNGYTEVLEKYTVSWDSKKISNVEISDKMFLSGVIELEKIMNN